MSEVCKSQWYAIIGDETRDVSEAEQFALSLCWVDSDYVIYEDFVGLIEVDQTDAKTLMETLRLALIALNVPLENCHGQAFDGASNMAGHLNGIAARFIQEVPKAHYIHCLAHSLNLSLQDCARTC